MPPGHDVALRETRLCVRGCSLHVLVAERSPQPQRYELQHQQQKTAAQRELREQREPAEPRSTPAHGLVLVLVHGGPGVADHSELLPLAGAALSACPSLHRVVLYDQAGCGRSDAPRTGAGGAQGPGPGEARAGLAAYVDELAQVLAWVQRGPLLPGDEAAAGDAPHESPGGGPADRGSQTADQQAGGRQEGGSGPPLFVLGHSWGGQLLLELLRRAEPEACEAGELGHTPTSNQEEPAPPGTSAPRAVMPAGVGLPLARTRKGLRLCITDVAPPPTQLGSGAGLGESSNAGQCTGEGGGGTRMLTLHLAGAIVANAPLCSRASEARHRALREALDPGTRALLEAAVREADDGSVGSGVYRRLVGPWEGEVTGEMAVWSAISQEDGALDGRIARAGVPLLLLSGDEDEVPYWQYVPAVAGLGPQDLLQHVYALLRLHGAALTPRQEAHVLVQLGRLRSASPEVLRALAESLIRRPSPPPLPQPSPRSTPLATTDEPPSPSPSPSASPSGPGLTRLTAPELAAVVFTLSAFSVRPSDAWLGTAMASLQLGLPQLSGAALARLLSGLVQLGVRPTSPWMALYEQALAAELARHAEQAQHAGQAGGVGERREGVGAGAGAHGGVAGQEAGAAHEDGAGVAGPLGRGPEELGPDDLVRVFRAAAEIGFQPGEQCRSLLLGAAGRELAAGRMAEHHLAGLAWALTRTHWPVEAAWGAQFLEVTSSSLPRFKPADLPPVVAFLASARLPAPPSRAWMVRCLAASQAALPQCSPRDLPDLLLNFLQLDPRLFVRRAPTPGPAPQATEAAALSAPVAAGGGAASAAEAEATEAELVAAAGSWLQRYLGQCTDKLPRFTAAGVARVLVAVAACGVAPGPAWLEAACAALASKSDVLAPSDLADAVTALAALRLPPPAPAPPPPPPLLPARLGASSSRASSSSPPSSSSSSASTSSWSPAPSASASASRSQQALLEALLAACETKLSLLSGRQLVGVAAAAAAVEVRPRAAWLRALLEETGERLERATSPHPAAAPTIAFSAADAAAEALPPALLPELLVAVAKLDAVPSRAWLTVFLRAAGRALPELGPAALAGLVWGLVVLDVRPPQRWTERLMGRVGECLGEGTEGRGAGGEVQGLELALAWAQGRRVGTAGQGQEGAGQGGAPQGGARPAGEGLRLHGVGVGERPNERAQGRGQGQGPRREKKRVVSGYKAGPYRRIDSGIRASG
ncbi:hypothetical protein HYH03_000718 [Edaphochlamys debaryana]|uniref:AB hydrolase-1 domain-containing protein n=1 Tax=Edaphochlamys debaryana TaxID=47281 RepID=A0A835YG12_9CHLO|nr:hypothetical protein HYH03_000718 [Edaphochlamys debaryana]|eukprot:KAG2502232.1 hypothetical protein HYH03_000718 [Edaphochlamys debaryana]